MLNLICLIDHILFQKFKIILSNKKKKQENIGYNAPVQIFINKIKNRIVLKIRTGYKLDLLSP